MKLRLLALTLMIAVSASGLPAHAQTIAPGGTFWDDDGNVHESYIEAIAAADITRGCGGPYEDEFCPYDQVTRGQMAAFLARALDLQRTTDTDWFADDEASIFQDSINRLADAGITTGCGLGLYCPLAHVSRAEMAAFLVRALDLPPGPDAFVDDENSIFEAEINALAAAGVTAGCNPPSNDRFCPSEDVRRDQMASFLGRGLDLTPLAVPARPTFTVSFTGDLLLHMPVNYAAAAYGDATGEAYDFRPMFEEVKPFLSDSDLAICHLEVPLSPTSTGLSGYPSFQGPAELADAIVDAGYDGCSVASNHSYDRSLTGVTDTIAVLEGRGLGFSGTARSQDERLRTPLYDVNGVAVAHLSYTYGLNGLVLPADKPWLVNLIDEATMLADAARARIDGADVVIMSIHWGSEYQTAPTPTQDSLGHSLIASEDIDLVVGHHAHVVQPIEEVGDEYIIYGLGNFLSNQQWSLPTQDGVIVSVEFAERSGNWVPYGATYTPTWVQGGTFRILPAAEAIAGGAESTATEASLQSSWLRTDSAIHSRTNDAVPTDVP